MSKNDSIKRDSLYQDIKDKIISGKYPVGTRLPKEFELAKTYDVARGTLREALKLLENENLIERIKGKGTYIHSLPSKNRPVITYLLPCPNYMTQAGSFAFRINQTMEGIMQRCQELNCQMETVAVSPTNSLDDIDWQQVDHLDSESRVIISAGWFFTLFDFLKKRNCKVFCSCCHNIRLSDPFNNTSPEFRPSREWFWDTDDIPGAFEMAVDTLWGKGCRSIAIAANLIDQPRGVVTQGYNDGLRKHGLSKRLCMNLPLQMPAWPYLREKLREWHKKEKFDGLLLFPRSADVPYDEIYSNSVLGLPDSVKIILVCRVPETSFRYGTLPMVYFDFFKKGYRGTTELMREPFAPREKIIGPRLSMGRLEMQFMKEAQYVEAF